MEPVTTTIAAIVGLICNFRQERGAHETVTRQQFIEWLENHRHEEIKNIIANNFNLAAEIDKLLHENHTDLVGRLTSIDQILATILSRLDDFTGLAHAIHPACDLSDQAYDILIRLYHGSADFLILIPHTSAGPILCMSPGTGVDLLEPKFIESDLSTLSGLGLLEPDYGSGGERLFKPTRAGAKFAKLLGKTA